MTKVLNLKPATDLQQQDGWLMKSISILVATVIGNRINHRQPFAPPTEVKKPVIVNLPGHIRHHITGIQMKILAEKTEHPCYMLVQLPCGSQMYYYHPEL